MQSTAQLLTQQPEVTAYFSMSNVNTFGAMQVLAKQNKRIPEDISIITFDDSHYFPLLKTPLTAVSQLEDEIGQQAFNMVLKLIEGDALAFQYKQVFPTKLVERESVLDLRAC
jgi:LacI family repressor for deo operon, udp, cdd, tsx, nupC, and nupG